MTGETVAVGVGNPTMGDDGFGRAVVRHLRETRPDLAATFAGTTAMLALEAMAGADRAVVVDAIGAEDPPGTVHRVGLDDENAPTEVTMHDFTFAEAVRACGGVYDVPARVVIVGVVPARVEPTVGLSEAVRPVVPDAAAAVVAELGGDRHGSGDRFMDARWYCVDCEAEIEADAVDEHEREGHSVRGRLRPERLLSQDPWQQGDDTPVESPRDGGGGVMCLGVPGEVCELDGPEARVDFGGAEKWVRVDIVGDEVAVGDYVLTHAGFAIRKIPERQVERTVELYEAAVAGERGPPVSGTERGPSPDTGSGGSATGLADTADPGGDRA